MEGGGCGGVSATRIGGAKKLATNEIAATPNAAGTKTFILANRKNRDHTSGRKWLWANAKMQRYQLKI